MRRRSGGHADASDRERLARRYARGAEAVRRSAARSCPLPRAAAPEALDVAAAQFPPTTALDALTPERLGDLLRDTGCIKIPQLIPPRVVDELVDDIDDAFDGCDRWVRSGFADAPLSSFQPFMPDEANALHLTRPWLRNGGGVLTGDAPRVANRWFDLVRTLGVFDVIADYFREAPVTSVDKCALRRIGRGDGDGVEWHQDGSFLGPENGAVNVWACLSDTAHAPGLDLVNRRFDRVVETGTRGAQYDWSVGPDLVRELAGPTPVVQPTFVPGDVLIFDGLLLHRTTPPERRQREARYAIETWFFRPSSFPSQQEIPLAI